VGRAEIGRVFHPGPEAGTEWLEDVIGACHHMGTTRMHENPARGVVDADCRVHGISNLWIAGSSVFPTSGCANPTLTLVALALRLGDRLRADLT
jgi:choline dehydrogenase-like flavoprotein